MGLDFGFDTSYAYAKELLETNGDTWKAKKMLREKMIGKSDPEVIEEMMRIIPKTITLEWMPTAIYKEPNKKDLIASLKVVDYATLDQTRYKTKKRKSTGDAEDSDDEMSVFSNKSTPRKQQKLSLEAQDKIAMERCRNKGMSQEEIDKFFGGKNPKIIKLNTSPILLR